MNCSAVSQRSAYRDAHDCERTKSIKKIEGIALCPNHYAVVLRGGKIVLQSEKK